MHGTLNAGATLRAGSERIAGATLVALFTLLAGGPDMLQAQENGPTAAPARTVTISATGTADAPPDQAEMMVAVETVGETAEEALSENARRANEVIATLLEAGIEREDIGTASFGVNPEYARPERGSEGQEPRIVGYRAYNMLRVVINDLESAGDVIDSAARAGSNRLNGPTFRISDPGPLRLAALRDAVDKARAEAEVLAASLGMALGDPIHVDTSPSGGGPYPVPMARAMAMEAAADTPIEGGTLSVSATVRITWGLLPR